MPPGTEMGRAFIGEDDLVIGVLTMLCVHLDH